MEDSCVYCQEELKQKLSSICPECKTKLIAYDGLEEIDLEFFRKNETEELYYHLSKIDDYFQSVICPDLSHTVCTKGELIFHKRRVICLVECISYIDPLFMLPKTKDDINAYLKMVDKFWDAQINKSPRNECLDYFNGEKLLNKLEDQGIRKLFSVLASEKENLDWSWFQYMEMYFLDLYTFIDNQKTMNIIKKHFLEEIKYKIEIKSTNC